MTLCCCDKGCDLFRYWVIPESFIQERLGSIYEQHPIMSRIVATPIAFFSGFLKVFLFPIICLVGIVTMPLFALLSKCKGRTEDSSNWLKAWGFCILGLGISIAFLAITCYQLPLVVSCGLFVGLLAVSITIHVYRLVKEPPIINKL
jgi:multidrug transporter EmrE-like cation transporter